MIRPRFFWLLFVFFSFSFFELQADLSDLNTFNRTILFVKEQYVQPERLNPTKMLMGSLESMQKQIPELVVTKIDSKNLKVQMGKDSQIFSIEDLNSLWDLSFKQRDIFRFIEPRLSPKAEKQEIEYAAINGFLSQLDPHSILLEPKFSKEMKLSTQGEFGGLGIVIGLRYGVLTVISPLDGTPADKAGIKALDKIIKIDDSSTINWALDEAVEKLRGKPKTKVTLTVQRKNETKAKVVVVVRDIIKVDSISSNFIDNQIGYVKVKAFHGNTSKDLKAAIDTFKNPKGLILDFRNNPGGLLNESVAVSDLFLDGGVVVITQGAGDSMRDEEKASVGLEKTKLPIVVLVNSGSASASEIVAGALKNRNRAIVVGEQTFGKGSVQMLYDFPDKSALKLTIAQYLTPGDESIQSVGITPDILLQPAYLENKNNLLLFPQTRTREEDLDLHLDNKTRIVNRTPSYEITYVTEKLTLEEQERLALSTSFKEDFEIKFAKRLLLQAHGSTRQSLLADAKKLVPQIEQEESAKIQSALVKLGVDWSMPAESPENQKLEIRVIGKPFAKAGENLKVTIEVKNTGKTPVYQVYGISKSASPLFADREFLFGKLAPGQKRVWGIDIELPKDVSSRQDFMRVAFNANRQSNIAKLEIPIRIQGLAKPILACSYQIGRIKLGEQTKIQVRVKNIGPGIAKEPIVLLKNKGDSDLFIEEGRQKLKALKPGETANAQFLFTERSKTTLPNLQIQLYDSVSGEFWVETLDLKTSQWITETPPQIRWLFNTNSPIVAKDSYRIRAEITGRPALKDAYMYVGEQKILYEAVKPNKPKKLLIEQVVSLKPGMNFITLVARDGETYSGHETLAIFSEVGDPLAKNP
ncbi:MAG: MXAN_5808 family serine peptidase [Myxococcaceae bacterium]